VGLFLLLSLFSIAQAKPASPKSTPSQPPQRGAAKLQTKVAGQNLKATINTSSNPPINGHSVSLTCSASTSPGVTGYNFYSGATKGGESATALNSTPTATCAWIDGTVIGTNTYWYIAKSYCPTCNPTLSVPSNELGPEVIPADAAPNPPTGLAAGTISKNQVPLFWNAPVQQNGYDVLATEIFRGTTPALLTAPRIGYAPSWQTSFTDQSPCKSKATCYYKVEALSLFEDYTLLPPSVASNIVKVTMP
jgi:hypothetical protein